MLFLSRYYKTLLIVIFTGNIISANSYAASVDEIKVGQFSLGKLDGWKAKTFDGNTRYQIVKHINGQVQVLKADSNNSASGLFKEQRIDLHKTPYLNWSWKTEQQYSIINQSEKQGDDYVARIYIVIDGGLFFWKTRALNYVWSTSFDVEDIWPNPFTSNATMLSVESGTKNIGKWVTYQRNVAQDLQKILGKEVRYIDAIAVMTDSDNSGQHAITYYGDITFSSTTSIKQHLK